MRESAVTVLVQRAAEEVKIADGSGWKINVELDLSSAIQICGNLQLALRHPANNGPSAELARKFIRMVREGIRDRGFAAHADMIGLGDDAANDVEQPI